MEATPDCTVMLIVEALVIGTKAKIGFSSKFEEIRYRQTAKLWLDLHNLWSSYDVNKFYGHNPLTGLPVTIIFNEQNQPHKRLLMWNNLMVYYMYSVDAGLTWEKVDLYPPAIGLIEAIENSDLILKWYIPNES